MIKKLFKLVFGIIIIAVILVVGMMIWLGKGIMPELGHTISNTIEKEVNTQIINENDINSEIEIVEQEEVNNNGISPEFKKSMESYEAFFDEYIEFMSSFKYEDAGLSALAKYTEFLTKYEKAMKELSEIDESKLTSEEDKLFLETQLRISNKLAQAAIDY